MPPPPSNRNVLLKTVNVDAMVTPQPPHIPVIVLNLEDGRNFTLYYVPYEIVIAINKLQRRTDSPVVEFGPRETLFEVLLDFQPLLKDLKGKLIRVIIDEFNYETALYTATVEFDLGGIIMKRKMVPSHAIYLALLLEKPIYVLSKLVDEQEALEEEMKDLEDEEQQT